MDTARRGRTRKTVSEALLSLMLEKPYDDITVDDLIDRAGVSRSTFYSHFDGKEDLLRSYHAWFFDHLAQSCMRRSNGLLVIAPVAAMLSHLQEKTYRDYYLTLRGNGKLPALRALDLERLASKFETELVQFYRGREPRIPPSAVARFIAATFFDLIDWWIDDGAARPPAEMEAVFHKLVEPALAAL